MNRVRNGKGYQENVSGLDDSNIQYCSPDKCSAYKRFSEFWYTTEHATVTVTVTVAGTDRRRRSVKRHDHDNQYESLSYRHVYDINEFRRSVSIVRTYQKTGGIISVSLDSPIDFLYSCIYGNS